MSVVDDVKQKLDIVDVVSQHVKLQKSGRNFKATCPFHSEKTASFFVFPEKQSWHCFGACGTGGDIFSFVMKKDGVDFGQALAVLAERAGVTLTRQSQQRTAEEDEREKRLFKICEVAAGYFHHLLTTSEDAEKARQYVEGRALTAKTIEDFQLGYSRGSWDDLSGYLAKAGYTEQEMLAVGLIVPREKTAGYYDRFRNRMMFPIRDAKGRVLGFGGRALDDSNPKYLNSPQTPLFDKSSIIYAIDRAQAAIRQKDAVVITEGYMDTITAHQHGFENTVACMGTSLTEKQITTLRKYSKNIIIALDADQAGFNAAERSINPIYEPLPRDHWMPWTEGKTYAELVKHEVQVIDISGGKDPDEIIRTSPQRWTELLAASQPIIDFTLKKELGNINRDDPKDKSALVSKFLPILAKIDDTVRRAHYVEKLARLLKLDQRKLQEDLFNLLGQENRDKPGKKSRLIKVIPAVDETSRRLEEYCLSLVINFPDLKKYAGSIDTNYFEHSENRDILLKWQSTQDMEAINRDLDPAMHDYVDHLRSLSVPPSLEQNKKERQLVLRDCVNRLHERYVRNREIEKKLVLAEEKETGDDEAQLASLRRHGIEGPKQLRDIFRKRGRLFDRTKGV